jgi:predicted negative regulator of RcsB-dependent stress response
MAELETDEERIEAIKKWWKNNGISVVAGVVIGLGGVLGWRAWVGHQNSYAQRASIAFEQLQLTAESGDPESVAKQVEAIEDDFGGTPYAMFASLTAARVAVENGDLAAAAAALAGAVDQAPDPALQGLAALRLARVQLAQGDIAAATRTLEEHDSNGAFTGDFAALRGDIAAAEGRVDAARDAYQAALDSGAGNARLIELKLDDLPAGDGTS